MPLRSGRHHGGRSCGSLASNISCGTKNNPDGSHVSNVEEANQNANARDANDNAAGAAPDPNARLLQLMESLNNKIGGIEQRFAQLAGDFDALKNNINPDGNPNCGDVRGNNAQDYAYS